MKNYKLLKYILYVAGAVVIFIFNESVMPYVGYLVGGIIFVYSIDELVFAAVEKDLLGRGGELFPVLSQILIATLLVLSAGEIVNVCVIWGVWSILREAKELTHAISNLTEKRPGILNAAESTTIIVMSFMMVLTPTEHHAHTHVILLGIELICVVLFETIEELNEKRLEKKLKTSDGANETEEKAVEEIAASEDSDETALREAEGLSELTKSEETNEKILTE